MAHPRVIAGRYEIRDRLGRGGMGEVWSAFDVVLRREVAVKLVELDATGDRQMRERFGREAMAAASLSHPNIVTVFDAGIDGSTAYLVMELLVGPTLAALVQARGSLPVDDVARYAGQATAALSASHAVGVIHRDIKPSNLMLDSMGQLKVVDFGIARLTQSGSAQLTATSTAVGSAVYMSPEQARGEAATSASDVYSLGCVLMTLLTGEPPFTGEHPMALLEQHLRKPPPRVSERRPDVSPAWDALIDEMLAKHASGRPTLPDVQTRLDAMDSSSAGPIEADLIPTAPLSDGALGGPTPATGATRLLGLDDQPADPVRRRRAILGVAVGVVALVAAAGLVWAIVASTSGDSTTGATGHTSSGLSPSSSAASGPSGPTASDEGTSSATTPGTSPTVAVAALRSAVDSMTESGSDAHAQDQLAHGVDKIEQALEKDPSADLAHEIDEFRRSLDHAVDKGEIDPHAEAQLRTAVADLERAAGVG